MCRGSVQSSTVFLGTTAPHRSSLLTTRSALRSGCSCLRQLMSDAGAQAVPQPCCQKTSCSRSSRRRRGGLQSVADHADAEILSVIHAELSELNKRARYHLPSSTELRSQAGQHLRGLDVPAPLLYSQGLHHQHHAPMSHFLECCGCPREAQIVEMPGQFILRQVFAVALITTNVLQGLTTRALPSCKRNRL